MVTLTPRLDDASSLLESVLIGSVKIYNSSAPKTEGIKVVRVLEKVSGPVPALVQSVDLKNAVESLTEQTFSIKVARETELVAGQVVEVVSSPQDPHLEGMKLLIGKVSLNGSALLRKGTASVYSLVNQEGKGSL